MRNTFRIALLPAVFVILYLSFYPFTFTRHAKESIAWHTPELAGDWIDVLQNLLFYMPLGFLAVASRRRPDRASVITAVVAGSMLSLAVELAQMYLPQRDSSFRDLACNAAGTLAGALIAMATRRVWSTLTIPWPSPIANVLIALWAWWQMFPFFPYLRRHKLWDLEASVRLWNFHALEFGDIALAAVVLYAFIAKPEQPRATSIKITAVVLSAVLLGQSLIGGMIFSNARIVAGLVGFAIAVLLWRRQWIALAVMIAAWAIFREFHDPALPLARAIAARAFFYLALAVSLMRGLSAERYRLR